MLIAAFKSFGAFIDVRLAPPQEPVDEAGQSRSQIASTRLRPVVLLQICAGLPLRQVKH
jgi:hypothetical protein